jgi:hypothetical protein
MCTATLSSFSFETYSKLIDDTDHIFLSHHDIQATVPLLLRSALKEGIHLIVIDQ